MTQRIHHHNTHISPIYDHRGHGWEFKCPACSFHMLYRLETNANGNRLELIDSGDPQASHASQTPGLSWEVSSSTLKVRTMDEESWLTPNLRDQIEAIVSGLD